MATVVPVNHDPFVEKRPTPSMKWVGWYRRPRQRWQRVCWAASACAAWRLLDAYRPEAWSVESERCVLREGEIPPPAA